MRIMHEFILFDIFTPCQNKHTNVHSPSSLTPSYSSVYSWSQMIIYCGTVLEQLQIRWNYQYLLEVWII